MYIKTGTADADACNAALDVLKAESWPERGQYCTFAGPHIMGFEKLFPDVLPPWSSAFCLVLAPGAQLEKHRDWLAVAFEARYHIVLKNNPQCVYNHGDGTQSLDQHGIYQFDPTIEHSSENNGDDHRVHLIVDVGNSTEI